VRGLVAQVIATASSRLRFRIAADRLLFRRQWQLQLLRRFSFASYISYQCLFIFHSLDTQYQTSERNLNSSAPSPYPLVLPLPGQRIAPLPVAAAAGVEFVFLLMLDMLVVRMATTAAFCQFDRQCLVRISKFA
jgi:hypothetical protein